MESNFTDLKTKTMEIGQKILDTIYKHNTSAYGASSECIDVVYEDDYDDLAEDLVKLFAIYAVSNRRELLLDYEKWLNEYPKLKDREKQVDKYLKK